MKMPSGQWMRVSAIWCCLIVAQAANALSVRMELRPEIIRLGESAHLVISVEGADRGPQPQLPAVTGLRIGGPSIEQSVSTTLINGRLERQQSVNYRFSVVPLEPGDYELGPLTYRHANQTIRVPAKTLRVVAGDAAGSEPASISDMVFAEISASKENVFVNQSFAVTIAIYSRGVNLGRNISLANMPDSGMQTQPFQEMQTGREVVHGNVYDVRRFQALIRPLTAGTIRFEPGLRVQVLVPRRQQQRDPFFQGFFSNTDAHPLDLPVAPLDVVVRSLPETDRPASFTGGVGEFRFNARVQETEVRPGDPITVTILIEGQGNIDTMGAPSVAESDHFRVYPPRVMHSDINPAANRGRRVFEQVVIPRTSESHTIPPLTFSYFDPDAGRYQTITSGPLPLNLLEADAADQRVVRAGGATLDHQARIVGQDIRYIKPAPARWTIAGHTPWYATRLFRIAQSLPLLAFIAVMLLARRRRVFDADAALARRYRAPRNARAGLKQAAKGLERNDEGDFYNGLWSALSAYFGDRLNLPSGAVTADVVIPAMLRQGLDPEKSAVLEQVFDACEQHRFGRIATEPEMKQNLLTQARLLLKACERISS